MIGEFTTKEECYAYLRSKGFKHISHHAIDLVGFISSDEFAEVTIYSDKSASFMTCKRLKKNSYLLA